MINASLFTYLGVTSDGSTLSVSVLRHFKIVMTVGIDPANVPPKTRGIYGSKGGISCRRSNGDTGHGMCLERSFRLSQSVPATLSNQVNEKVTLPPL